MSALRSFRFIVSAVNGGAVMGIMPVVSSVDILHDLAQYTASVGFFTRLTLCTLPLVVYFYYEKNTYQKLSLVRQGIC